MTLQLESSVIKNGDTFPIDYTCNGRNINPPLKITNVPQGSASLVLLFDDPDAAKEPAGNGKTFDHWVIYNLPAADQEIAEDSIPSGCELGRNSTGRSSYIGPCPPTFQHKYIFRLFALDCSLHFTDQPKKDEIESAIKGHIIEKAELISFYKQPDNG